MTASTLTDGPIAFPVINEATVMARLDALVAEHGLPEPTSRRFHLPPYRYLGVTVTSRAEVARWAAVLDVKVESEHYICEYEDGRWYASWNEAARRPQWLADVNLVVSHDEYRMIDRPAVTS